MSDIRGEVFIGIGVVVLITSFFRSSLAIFMYIGGFMVLYGLIRTVIQSHRRKKEALHKQAASHNGHPHQTHQHAHNHAPQQVSQHAHNQTHQHAHHTAQTHQNNQHRPLHPHSVVPKQPGVAQQHPSVKRCPSCHNTMPSSYRHCPNCGYGF